MKKKRKKESISTAKGGGFPNRNEGPSTGSVRWRSAGLCSVWKTVLGLCAGQPVAILAGFFSFSFKGNQSGIAFD
jgi:hypothetical protein